jgi:hypothetical protein
MWIGSSCIDNDQPQQKVFYQLIIQRKVLSIQIQSQYDAGRCSFCFETGKIVGSAQLEL